MLYNDAKLSIKETEHETRGTSILTRCLMLGFIQIFKPRFCIRCLFRPVLLHLHTGESYHGTLFLQFTEKTVNNVKQEYTFTYIIRSVDHRND